MRFFNINFLLWVTLLVISCSTHKKMNLMKKDIEVKVIMLPNDLDVRSAINSEEKFNMMPEKYLDTIDYILSNKLLLGKRIKQYEFIDIRTKVELRSKNSKVKKLFLNAAGEIKYKDKYYSGSIEILNFFRQSR